MHLFHLRDEGRQATEIKPNVSGKEFGFCGEDPLNFDVKRLGAHGCADAISDP